MSPTRNTSFQTPLMTLVAGAFCALCLLVGACKEDPLSPSGPGGGPDAPGNQGGGGGGGADGGVGNIPSDGGLFVAKPTCSTATCPGACTDGGTVCTGNCGFLTPVSYPLTGEPVDLAVGDLQTDGYDDLVTADRAGRTVSVLLNRQSGRFQTPSRLGAGQGPAFVALSNLDSNAVLDILVANSTDASLGVYRGGDRATFQSPTLTSTGGGPLKGLAVWDVTAGRRVGVLRADTQTLSVFEVTADGTLANPVSYPSPSGPSALVVADFNGDAQPDVAIAHENPCGTTGDTTCESVGVLLGRADGTLDPQQVTKLGGKLAGLLAARLDIDALPDLIVADASRNQVLVMSGLGTGTFQAPVAYPVVKAPSRMVLADINRDTVLDLLVMSTTGSQVSLLLGQPGGTFAPQATLDVSTELGLHALAVSDFDKDNIQDLAVLTSSGIQMLWGVCR